MVGKVRAITDSTLIPISMVIVVIGGIVWLTNNHDLTVANAKAIEELKVKDDAHMDALNRLDRKIVKIMTKLGIEDHHD